MIDFQAARKDAYEWISKIEKVNILNDSERLNVGIIKNCEIWEVITEISSNQELETIIFHLFISDDFPLSVPKIHLSNSSFTKFGNLPHVDTDKNVCTFPNNALTDPRYSGRIVEEVIRRAKRIIEEGLGKKNLADYEEEFRAYWAGEYDKHDKVINVLFVCTAPLKATFKVITLDKNLAEFRYIIHQNEPDAINLKAFLNHYEIKFNEGEGLNLGMVAAIAKPPFSLTNRDTIDILRKTQVLISEFEKFIDSKLASKFIVFSKSTNDAISYYGWLYRPINLNRKGFRSGVISKFQAISTYQSKEHVTRFNVEELTTDRLANRSSGVIENSRKSTFVIAGLGSVGSNLVHFLNTCNKPEFRFIDDEVLNIENIGRHLLGFEHVGRYKTLAINDYLLRMMPTQVVSTRELSIVKVIQDELGYVNEASCLFVAIGKTNIEKWIAYLVGERVITIPVCFLWVEPYLAGGHFVYITPGDKSYPDFFAENGRFRFNIIHDDEYENSNAKLSLKEAGCQTNFIPYSASNTVSFLGAIFPIILTLLDNKANLTKSLTWVGNLKTLNALNIRSVPKSSDYTFGQLIENNL